jgi:hypothetical protein
MMDGSVEAASLNRARGRWILPPLPTAFGIAAVVLVALLIRANIDHRRAVDQVVQASLRTTLIAAQPASSDSWILARNLSGSDRVQGMTFVDANAASSGPTIVSVAFSTTAAGRDIVAAAVRSSSGTCFYAELTPSATTYGRGTTCTGTAALSGATHSSW